MVKKFLYKVFCGFFLGLSVFAPGFSGSVIAIIMGIYQDILRIVSNPFKQLKQNIIFCIPLGIGVAISAVLFVIVFRLLFDSYEKATYLLFVGLIAGNLPVIFAEVRKRGFKARYLVSSIAAFAAALTLGLFAVVLSSPQDAEGVTSGLLVLALGGLAGGITILMPGMSVSIVLIIAGVYSQIIYMADLLLHFDFTYLVHFGVFALCAVAGLVMASRGIKTVFDRFPGLANSLVFGFVAGSLLGVFIQSLMMRDDNFSWLFGGFMLVAGLAVSMLFLVLGKAMKPKE